MNELRENEQNLTENRAQIIEKAKQEGILSACFMSFTVLALYVADFFPKLQEKHSWTALSILALVLDARYRCGGSSAGRDILQSYFYAFVSCFTCSYDYFLDDFKL